MARIHDPIVITSAGSMPSLGSLLGTRVSDVFDSINNQGHASFFGNELDHLHQDFFDRHLAPLNVVEAEVTQVVNLIMNPDRIRPLVTFDDFLSVPTVMEIPILMFDPVYKAFQEGRVEGWGYNPDSLPDEDVHGRLLDNHYCEDVESASDDDGYYDITATLRSTDPDLTDDELYAIRKTRQFILDRIIETSDRDPTAIELPRG